MWDDDVELGNFLKIAYIVGGVVLFLVIALLFCKMLPRDNPAYKEGDPVMYDVVDKPIPEGVPVLGYWIEGGATESDEIIVIKGKV